MVLIGTKRPALKPHESDNDSAAGAGLCPAGGPQTQKAKDGAGRYAGSVPGRTEESARKEGARGGNQGVPPRF